MQAAKNHRLQAGRPVRFLIAVGFLLVVALAVAACQSSGPPPAATEAPAAAAATEAPAEEVAATEAPAEEAAATEEPAEEAAATEEPAEEAAATEEPAEEAAAAGTTAGDPVNGQYIATVTGGCGCHFNSDLSAMAGGREFKGPFGVVYAANITSDPETGIASRSDETLIQILRTGQAVMDNGDTYVVHPIMPYKTFSIMSDQDAQDVVAYLRTLEPVANAVPARELTEEPQAWTPATTPPAEAPTDPVERGGYLVTLANCANCHTPKTAEGGPNAELMLAGATMPGDSGEVAANITPDEATGIGKWTEDEIATFMLTGARPNGKELKGAMAQQIERRFSKLTEEDAKAIGAYLKSLPAVSNDPYAQ